MKINILSLTKFLNKHRTACWLALFMLVGLLLRTYRFHEWLHFGKDQARDAFLTQAAARGDGPWPLLGAAMGNTPFKIGPAYYYFQIISAKLFGEDPSALAYPDVLFSLATIPLLYVFFKRYFAKNISLILVGMYGISYFAIIYSRFAWNPNPIPFFVTLFLLSLHELLVAKDKVTWKWVLLAGLAMGIGTQLHAIMLIALPTVAFLVLGFVIYKHRQLWKKALVVFAIAFLLNSPQMISEYRNSFGNFRILTEASSEEASTESSELPNKILLNIACHVQADTHMLTSLGDRYDCNYVSIFKRIKKIDHPLASVLLVLVSLAFAIFGYASLIKKARTDASHQKRYFLAIMVVYSVVYFPLLIPAIDGASHRYFIGLFFLPYVFFGFLLEYVLQKHSDHYRIIMSLCVGLVVLANLFTVTDEARSLANGTRGTNEFAVLGQLEQMRDYMITQSNGDKKIYLSGGSRYFSRYIVPLSYVFSQVGMKLFRSDDESSFPEDANIYYIWANSEGIPPKKIGNYSVVMHKNFGNLGIYKLEN